MHKWFILGGIEGWLLEDAKDMFTDVCECDSKEAEYLARQLGYFYTDRHNEPRKDAASWVVPIWSDKDLDTLRMELCELGWAKFLGQYGVPRT